MAPPAGTLRVGRYFLALVALLAIVYGLVFYPGARHTPQLGLDLKGGAQIVFQAKSENGKKPTSSQMSEARDIIDRRVNGLGVANSTVVVQGQDKIVVSVPGKRASDLKNVGSAAVLNFRGLVMPAVILTQTTNATPTGTPTASTSGTPTGSTSSSSVPQSGTTSSAHGFLGNRFAAATPTPTPTSPTPTPTPTSSAPPARTADPLKGLTFPIPTSETDYDKLTAAQQQQLQQALANIDCASTQDEPDLTGNHDFVACDTNSNATAQLAYLLGPIIVPGHEISSASALAPNPAAGSTEWSVNLNLKSSGESAWAKYTSAHNVNNADTQAANITNCGASTFPCADYVAFTLDGVAISTPINESAINGGTTQITGGGASGFTQSSAKELANQLKYGSLPLSFNQLTSTTVSATLGTAQLKAGLLAGGIGLILVVIYSLIYYRALGLVTIASLLVSGTITYGALVFLGREIGFTLTLAGIAGFIVAVGITADSFVVFFERIKDEVHEGRTVRVGIPRAWVRARRTILSADTVSFLAAAILYYFAAGDVKGFAFTLGMSTVIDLIVVFLFTHPLVSLLSRSRAFGSARFTGLDAVREGGVTVAPKEPKLSRQERRAQRAQRVPTATAEYEYDYEDEEVPAAVAVLDDDGEIYTESEEVVTTRPGERRRTKPAPGSAAERAAQRRAQQREKGGR